jgi:hypothetical protein
LKGKRVDQRDPEGIDWEGHPVATAVSEHIRAIISSAEAAASAVRHEAEQEAQRRHRLAEADAQRLLDDARRDAEAFLTERVRKIEELSDAIIERAEAVLAQLARAEAVKEDLQSLVDALGRTAEELARESEIERTARAAAMEKPAEPEAVAPATASPEPIPEQAQDEAETVPPPDLRPVEPRDVEDAAEAQARGPEPASAAEEPHLHPAPEAGEPAAAGEWPSAATGPSEPAADGNEDESLGARLVALQMAVAGGNRGEVEAHLRRAFQLTNPDGILDDVFGRGTNASKRVIWPSAADA